MPDTGIERQPGPAIRLQRHDVPQARPYERTDTRQGYANGFKPKTVATRMAPIIFSIPQVPDWVAFYPSALEKGVRSEQAAKLALAAMHVQDVSTRKVTAGLERLCGLEIGSTQVSTYAAHLDLTLADWCQQPLGCCPTAILDARHENIRHAGQLLDFALPIALVNTPDGKCTILGVSVAEPHWRTFLLCLQQRGPIQVAAQAPSRHNDITTHDGDARQIAGFPHHGHKARRLQLGQRAVAGDALNPKSSKFL